MNPQFQFSRFDTTNPLSTCSAHPILLEDVNWLTCEHYVQAKSLRADKHAEKVVSMPTGEQAHKYGNAWYRANIPNYQTLAPVFMRRALFTKVQMYDEVRETLLNTGEQDIIEMSLYDHFWGIGRDQRGHNHLGKAWMDIRDKILSEN